MPSARQILASLEGADRGMRFDLVGSLGRIRRQKQAGGVSFYLDFRPYGRVWSHRGIRITDEATASRLLEAIRAKVAEGRSLGEVLAEYLPTDAKPNLIPAWIGRWLGVKRREVDAGDRSPTYLRELERYAKPEGHFSFLSGHSIHEIDYGLLEDWSLWLADRGLSPKTRWNVLGAFRSFVGWLRRRGEIREIPEFPWPKTDEHEPRILSIDDQDRVLMAIPDDKRGIFLALAHMGIRPGEARALEVADYHDGWLTIDKACKGPSPEAPVRGTKTGRGKRLPVPESLQAWITSHVPRDARLRREPLFVNPSTGRRFSYWALRETWKTAAAAVGLPEARLYEGTKHTMATDAVRRGVSERALQMFLGHADVRSTRRYARMSEHALLSVLRPNQLVGDLSVAAKRPEKRQRNRGVMASPAGFEPALPA